MRDPAERDASLALRSGRGNRLRKAIGWYRKAGRLHTGDEVTMADGATTAYIHARAAGKDVAILCDRWEMADAINHRLSAHYTRADASAVEVSRDQRVHAGDLIITRRNDADIAVDPGPDHRRGQQVDQVRNGNRWQVTAIDTELGRIVAIRLTDNARAEFHGDYLREHITLGYAGTVHSAQGMTVGSHERAGVCWTILSEKASRAMAYVGMTRARDDNHLAIYAAATNEADKHRRDDSLMLGMRRGTRHHAANLLHTICTANDDRSRTLHTVAEQADRTALPAAVRHLLERNDARRATRIRTWRQDLTATQVRANALQRLTSSRPSLEHDRGRRHEYGLEL